MQECSIKFKVFNERDFTTRNDLLSYVSLDKIPVKSLLLTDIIISVFITIYGKNAAMLNNYNTIHSFLCKM